MVVRLEPLLHVLVEGAEISHGVSAGELVAESLDGFVGCRGVSLLELLAVFFLLFINFALALVILFLLLFGLAALFLMLLLDLVNIDFEPAVHARYYSNCCVELRKR